MSINSPAYAQPTPPADPVMTTPPFDMASDDDVDECVRGAGAKPFTAVDKTRAQIPIRRIIVLNVVVGVIVINRNI